MIKCIKCGLENLDHVSICVECGNPLIQDEDTKAELILYPPRAGKFKFFRIFFYKILRNTGSLNTKQPEKNENEHNGRPWGELLLDLADFKWALASVIPGFGHVLQKRYYRAFMFFALWLACILFGIFFYGRIISNICFGCAIAIHASAAFDCLPLSLPFFNNIRSRVSIMASLLIFTIICYYLFFNIVNDRIFGTWINYARAEPFFLRGDFLLVQRQDNYKRGDIVFYETHGQWGSRGYDANFYIPPGIFFDRIVGLPGENIEIIKGKIFVNDKPLNPEYYPIKQDMVRDMKVVLAENQYFIYDSLSPRQNQFPIELLRLHNVVEEDNIQGRAFMIYAPLSRIKFID